MTVLERVLVIIVRLIGDSWQYLLCSPTDNEMRWEEIQGEIANKEKSENTVRRLLMDKLTLSPMMLISTGLEYEDQPTEEEQRKYEGEIEKVYRHVFMVRVNSTFEPIINMREYKKYQWFSYKEADKLVHQREQEALRYCKNILEE